MKKRFITVILVTMITGLFNMLHAQISYSGCSNSGANSNALGLNSIASGAYSFAAGNNVHSMARGSFVFGSGSTGTGGIGWYPAQLTNTTENSFLVGFEAQPVLFARLKPEPSFPSFGAIYGPMVGIGTMQPEANLDVIGTTKVEKLIVSDNIQYEGEGLSFRRKIGVGEGIDLFPTMIIKNGKVGIGMHDVSSYKLAVNGSIGCKEIFVEAESWPDYVFSGDYSLRSLSEVASFISENGHLPEVPSAGEVEEAGVGLGEMNTILLKKIEELTLYILQQQEQIEFLSGRVESLEKE